MSTKLRTHSAAFKAKISLLALKGEMTIAQISSKFSIHATQITRWKKICSVNTL